MAVVDLVRRTSTGYKVLYQEHAWSNDGGEAGFLDVVLQDSREGTVLALECKRVFDNDWIFLQGKRPVITALTAAC